MAAPLILARTFKDAHAFAQNELGLSIGYYRVVNSAGTIKACRNVDIFLVEGWDKRPDRFTMKSALKWCRLNIRDVAEERKRAAEFDAAMPPAPADPLVHWVTPQFSMAHAVEDVAAVKSSPDKADVDCDVCLAAIASLEERQVAGLEQGMPTPLVAEMEPVAELPEPAEAEEVSNTLEAPIDEAEPEIVVAEDNRPASPEAEPEPTPEPIEAKPAKRRRRSRCSECGNLHFKEEACPPSEDA